MSVNRTALLLALLAACGHKASPQDECATIAKKVRPVLAKMGADAAKPMSEAQLDEFSKGFCEEKGSDDGNAFRACVLDADDDAATAACMKPLFEDYANEMKKGVDDLDAKQAEFRKQRDEIEKQRDEQEAKFRAMADAAVDLPPIDAASPRRPLPLVDVATLTEWPVPAGTKATGPSVELYVVDIKADGALSMVWDPAVPLLAVASGGMLSGKIVGKSKAEAAAAVAAAAGIKLVPVTIKGKGAAVDISFAGAPQRDLFRVFADTLKVNIVVAPGDLPDVDIITVRKPADGVLDALVALDGLVTQRYGNVIYVAPKDRPLPALAKVGANTLVDLEVKDGSAGEAMATLRAVAPGLTVGACDGTKFELRLHKAPLAEAVRAIQLMSGATLVEGGDGGCGIAPTTLTALPAGGVVSAITWTEKASAAVIRTSAKTLLVEKKPPLDIGHGYVAIGDTALQVYNYPDDYHRPPADVDQWLATTVRTVAVLRQGSKWRALLEDTHGNSFSFDPSFAPDVFVFGSSPPRISEKGLQLSEPASISIPLAKKP